MKKFLKFSKLIIIMAIIMINLIEYLFVNVSFADYPTGVYPHDTEPNPTMDEIDKKQGFKLTYFGGAATCSGFSVSDFTQNPKYGWYEFNYNGVNYVVTAIASYAYFKYYTDANWKDYIQIRIYFQNIFLCVPLALFLTRNQYNMDRRRQQRELIR